VKLEHFSFKVGIIFHTKLEKFVVNMEYSSVKIENYLFYSICQSSMFLFRQLASGHLGTTGGGAENCFSEKYSTIPEVGTDQRWEDDDD